MLSLRQSNRKVSDVPTKGDCTSNWSMTEYNQGASESKKIIVKRHVKINNCLKLIFQYSGCIREGRK